MAFSTQSELVTFAELRKALGQGDYSVSQKVRVLDVVEAVAARPAETTPPGSSVLDVGLPAMREGAGCFGEMHPWLRPGDWSYAFRSHFDFVVHAPLGERAANHPLFAVEFDGPQHADRETKVRDCRKNRLCLASGLPLVRIDESFLFRRERLSLIAWLAELWVAWRAEMPDMIAERDEQIAALSDQEGDDAGMWLMAERPDLDVNFCFGLGHPYPPIAARVDRLARRYHLRWPMIVRTPLDSEPRWKVNSAWPPAILDLWHNDSPTQRWTSRAWLNRSSEGEEEDELSAVAEVRAFYPIDPDDDGTSEDALWAAIAKETFPCLPAGPFGAAPDFIGQAMCTSNLISELGDYLHLHD